MNPARETSYIVGVAGGTGSGKTTVARAIMKRVGPENALLLQHDSYYRDYSDKSADEKALINFDHPESLESELLVEHLKELRAGRAVATPIYDFSNHARLPLSKQVDPRPVIIVEGILVLSEPALREMMNMKVYVYTDADLRFIRRLKRDILERGRDLESIIRQYLETVKPMHDQFVEPSRRYADVIVPEGGHNEIGINLLVAKLRTIVREGRVV